MHRLRRLSRADIGISGTAAASHWDRDFGLLGDPRLDLCVHCPEGLLDLGFVHRLDAALGQTEEPGEPAILVVHTLRRAVALFEMDSRETLWADPVECLLDLHEMRLEPQVRQFLESFTQSRGGR